MSCTDPDHPDNWPRNLFVWRSNLLGSSRQGPRVLPQAPARHQQRRAGQGSWARTRPSRPRSSGTTEAPEGKLDLLVTLDFRMSTTCLYSDIVLPTATWYEKNDLNTSDMHPFIHPLSTAVDPAWQIAQRLGHLQGLREEVQRGLRRPPRRREGARADAADARQPGRARPAVRREDWKRGECELVPGKTAPQIAVVERDYPNVYKRFTALGPLMGKVGNGGKGIAWNTQTEVKQLGELNGTVARRRRDPRHAEDRDRHRRLRGRAAAGARDQRPRRGEGVGGAVEADRPRPHAPRAAPRGREDPLPRHPGAAAQDHQLADVERHRERDRHVQRRLHQRARADSLAHAHRPAAVLPGPPVDDRLRRGLLELSPAGRPQDHRRRSTAKQRQPRDRAQLHHAAPEVGHPQHLHRQPDDAHAEPRRAVRLAHRGRRREGAASSTTTGSSSSTSTARSRRARS